MEGTPLYRYFGPGGPIIMGGLNFYDTGAGTHSNIAKYQTYVILDKMRSIFGSVFPKQNI